MTSCIDHPQNDRAEFWYGLIGFTSYLAGYAFLLWLYFRSIPYA